MRLEILSTGLIVLLAVAQWGLHAAETPAVTLAADLPAPYKMKAENQRLNLHGWKRTASPFRDISWPKHPGEAEVCLWKGDKYAAASITIDECRWHLVSEPGDVGGRQ